MPERSDIFDKVGVLDRVAGDEGLLGELIKIAEGQVAASMPKLIEAIERADWANVQGVTHSLRSVLGNLGALKVYAALTELERAAERGQIDRCRKLAPSIAKLIEEFFSVSKAS